MTHVVSKSVFCEGYVCENTVFLIYSDKSSCRQQFVSAIVKYSMFNEA